MLHDPEVEHELQAEFERDRLAFEGLPPRQQRIARIIARTEFGGRRVVVEAGKAVIGFAEFAANLLLRLPYVLAARAVAGLANRLVDLVKLGVHAFTGCGRALLAAGRGCLALGKRGIKLLEKTGLLSTAKGERGSGKLDAWSKKLTAWRDGLVEWTREKTQQIDRAWLKAKEELQTGLAKTMEFCEYYGALGLYRGTKWVLNPRLPNGKPLLGSEKLNQIVGLTVAACGFVFLSFELSKLFILGKLWHIKIAHSFIRDAAPLPLKLLKQATIQPLLAAGLFSAKFLTLPAIAATRGALKSTRFTQGVAYLYNLKLREKQVRKQKPAQDAAAKASKLGKAARAIRKHALAVTRYLHKKTFHFVGKFVEHIIEKSSPEFYEARLKHYQNLRAAKLAAAVAAPKADTPAVAAPVAPAPQISITVPALTTAPALGEAFQQARLQTPAVEQNDAPVAAAVAAERKKAL